MAFFKKKTELPFLSAVVAAAGASSRMEGADKQLLLLDGVPVVVRSIAALQECPRISEIVVVCREECIAEYYDMVRFYGLDKVSSIVKGAAVRQDSVFAGISACNGAAAFYAVHDGARPLAAPEEIERCIDAAFETGAAAVGVPVKDTIKICDEHGAVVSTPRRDRLFSIQTPQIFEAELYRRAMAAARHENRDYTDDCQLVEAFGRRVVVSQGSYENIKITTPEDLALAGAILAYREEGFAQWRYE